MIDMQMLEGKSTLYTDMIKNWKKYNLTDTKDEMETFIAIMIIRKLSVSEFLKTEYKPGDELKDLYVTVDSSDKKQIIKQILKHNLLFKSHYDIGFYVMDHEDQFVNKDVYEGSANNAYGIIIVPEIYD